jgi:hypothetical protein
MSATFLLLFAAHAYHKDVLAKWRKMPKTQRSQQDLTRHKQSMSARKTMFQAKKKDTKEKDTKAAAATQAHDKAEAEASASRRISALEDYSDEKGNEGRHLSEERIDVDSDNEGGEAEETDPPATPAEAARNSASEAAIFYPSSGPPSLIDGQEQTLPVNPSPLSNSSHMPPPAPKTPSVLVLAIREVSKPPFLPPLLSPQSQEIERTWIGLEKVRHESADYDLNPCGAPKPKKTRDVVLHPGIVDHLTEYSDSLPVSFLTSLTEAQKDLLLQDLREALNRWDAIAACTRNNLFKAAEASRYSD